MPNYKIEKPEGAPDWFTPGIVCEVWDYDEELAETIPVVWYKEHASGYNFITSIGEVYRHAKPVERWVPEDGEYIFYVDRRQLLKSIPQLGGYERGLYADQIIYRYTDEVHEAIKAGILTVGWLREHGEKYEEET